MTDKQIEEVAKACIGLNRDMDQPRDWEMYDDELLEFGRKMFNEGLAAARQLNFRG